MNHAPLAVCALALLPALASAGPLEDKMRDAFIGAHDACIIEVPAQRASSFEVAFDYAGQAHTLALRERHLRAPGFRVLVDRGDGRLTQVPAPKSALYAGTLIERAGSTVTATIIDGTISAIVTLDDETWTIQPASAFADDMPAGTHVVYSSNDTLPTPFTCDPIDPGVQASDTTVKNATPRGGGLVGAEIAWDVDFGAFTELGSTVANAVAEVESITAGVNTIYERDAQITYLITDIVVRTNAGSDPYTQTFTTPFLEEVSDEWNGPLNATPRDLVHVLTGKDIENEFGNGVAGVAYVDVVCSDGFGFGITENLVNPGIEIALVAHELGHNWSAMHCNGEGTCRIMCSTVGACSGVGSPNFASTAIASITSARDAASCLEPVGTMNDCVSDLNGDGVVDIIDFGTFGTAFGTSVGEPNWNADADFNGDDTCDIIDFGTFGMEFNRTDCLSAR